jgi:hypothetical protein
VRPGAGAAAPSADSSGATPTQPVGRLPEVWRQASASDFRAGTLQGVTVSSRGEVRPAPTLRKLAESSETYFWCLVPDGASGGVFAGTGDNGQIIRVAPDGKQTVFARTGEAQVVRIVRAPDGTLYAGTLPFGRVLRVLASGAVSTLLDADEQYVTDLALSSDAARLYVATSGPGGRIYEVPLSGKAEVKGEAALVYENAENQITDLALAPDGALYAGMTPARVLRFAGPADAAAMGKDRRPTVVYEAGASSGVITGLDVDRAGNLYLTTSSATRGTLIPDRPEREQRQCRQRPRAVRANAWPAFGPAGCRRRHGLVFGAIGPLRPARRWVVFQRPPRRRRRRALVRRAR